MNVRRINPRTWNSADEDKQILRMMIPVVVELILAYIIANINQIVLNKFSDTAVAAHHCREHVCIPDAECVFHLLCRTEYFPCTLLGQEELSGGQQILVREYYGQYGVRRPDRRDRHLRKQLYDDTFKGAWRA